MLRRSLFLLFLVIVCMSPARAENEGNDLALVLAVDASGSVDRDRWGLQLNGYAEAFRSKEVIDAIRSGQHGAIMVTMVQWAGVKYQVVSVAWHRVSDAASAEEFAQEIEHSRRRLTGNTSISGGIYFSLGLLINKEFPAERNVIDVSGDGANNSGWPARYARNAALNHGVTINGLPILSEEPGLAEYYRQEVIGGRGAFLIAAESYEDFATAIRRKLVLEIASR